MQIKGYIVMDQTCENGSILFKLGLIYIHETSQKSKSHRQDSFDFLLGTQSLKTSLSLDPDHFLLS